MKRKRFIETQKLQTIKGKLDAYDAWIARRFHPTPKGKLGDRFEFLSEPLVANPDQLTEASGLYSNSQMTQAQELMSEAVEHLQGLQRDCYMLTMRQGLSFTEAGKLLRLSKSDVQGYRTRAVKFVTEYVKRAIKNGRLDAD